MNKEKIKEILDRECDKFVKTNCPPKPAITTPCNDKLLKEASTSTRKLATWNEEQRKWNQSLRDKLRNQSERVKK